MNYPNQVNSCVPWNKGKLTGQKPPLKLQEIWKRVKSMLTGHLRYYGVNENSRSLRSFLYEATKILFKWLNRRSQRRSFDWDKFNLYLKKHPLPKPRIIHNG